MRGGFGEAAGAGGLGAVGVGDGERERLGDLPARTQPSAEGLDQAENCAVMLVWVELVAVESAARAHRSGRGAGDDGALVDAKGAVVGQARCGGPEDALGRVAWGSEPV
ncbi:hypothetical protein GCM10010284_67660 [Streptomyces rubiginosohelvolus]|nr:hypothetical protein GCM10010284_67660 [Streptomyces rubiginosohelvolus]